MDSETVERVSEWESEGFTGGYEGLRGLADREFTGAVSDGRGWLFVLNGRVVGVTDATHEAFADADGTADHPPHPSRPQLFAMQVRGGETRAKYYTEDTPLSEADRTLSSGNFTGYVELSENVLSGDYYVVYHGGESMAAAFVGNSRELLTGDEAFDRADGEVGIYEVKTVDVDVQEIPDPDETGDSGAAAAAGGAGGGGAVDGGVDGDDAGSGTDGPNDVDGVGAADVDESTPDDEPGNTSDPADGQAARGSTDGTVADDDVGPEDGTATSTSVATTDAGTDDSAASETTSSAVDSSPTTGSTPDSGATSGAAGDDRPNAERSASDAADTAASSSAGRSDAEVFEEEAQWRETTTIPALDPGDADGDAGDGDAGATAAPAASDATESSDPADTSRTAGADRTGELRGRMQNLETKLAQVAEERDELREERDRLQARIDELEGERDAAREQVRELESRVERLESELEAATADAGGGTAGATGGHEQPMSPTQVLSGTNLFVRYDSKGRETLEDVASGADRDEVNRNLRLETHTGFESEDVVVDDQPYEEWLADTVEYGFARWVVQDLPYEIRDTDGVAKLRDLYDALPDLDRIEFDGQVAAESENGAGRQFDVVCRDRMGDPLIVANLNDSLDAATEGQMSDLVEAAQAVGQAHDSLSAAFSVTSSYFAPAALETADEATGGGLLSRDRRESFVRLARKQGFHLCLVETRNGEYHVNVPEL